MSPSLSSPTQTWQVVLPWLDQLTAKELLALQRLGGPAQWWLRETPEETNTRRPYMDDVFDLFASFLYWGRPATQLGEQKLLHLFPCLPENMPTAHLDVDVRALPELEAAIGRTLGQVGQLTVVHILNLPRIRMAVKRELLAALVGVSVTLPPPDRTDEYPTPTGREVAPDAAVCTWFAGLDARQKGLITLHLCAEPALPVDELAVRHRTMRQRMTELLDELPDQLEEAASGLPGLRSALQMFTAATASPVQRGDLLAQHPWVATALPGSDPLVIDLLTALRAGSTDGEWVFQGSLQDMRDRTREALALGPGECMFWDTARRLLKDADSRLRATDGWLRYCGFRLVDDRQVERDETSPAPVSPRRATTPKDDYVLAPPQAAGAVETPPAADHASSELIDALERLRVYAREHRPSDQLADLLRDSDEFPEPLRTLVARLLAAAAGPDGWALPETAPADEPPAASAREHEEGAGTGDRPRRGTLTDRAWAVLDELGHPMDSVLLVERMGDGVNMRSLKAQLPRDPRFVRSDVDSWALAGWGFRPYTTIKALVAEEVDRANGSIRTDALVAILTREFTINESSVRQVASSPPFTARGGVVRRLSDVRREGDQRLDSADDTADDAGDDGPTTEDLINLMGL
ncbi:hypothetical protein ACFU5Z_02185 [Streptomyces sp. NPDC057521]|uniref:hypothetical protein n=1 Tax=Streptomyces sp. NPDC057521 TaxID=3346156 RepID=UPI0036C39B6B